MPLVIVVEVVKFTNSFSVVAFNITPVSPGIVDWFAFAVPISSGTTNIYRRTPSTVHLIVAADDSERVQVNSTMSPGHGFSWLRSCRLTSCGITRDFTLYVPAPVFE